MVAGWSGTMKNLGVWLVVEVGPSDGCAVWISGWTCWVVPGFSEGPAGVLLGGCSSLSPPCLCSDPGAVDEGKCAAVLKLWDSSCVAGVSAPAGVLLCVCGACDVVDLTADGVTGVVSWAEGPEGSGVDTMWVECGPVCVWSVCGSTDECADDKCETRVAKDVNVGPCVWDSEPALLPVAAAFWATSSTAVLGVEEEAVITQSDTRETDPGVLSVVGVWDESPLVCVSADVV